MNWRLLETWDAPADWNMAVDAYLLAGGDDAARTTLRFYTWSPEALSLGYFQKLAEVPAAAGREPGRALVRRTTGGGAIHHARELTFSIAAPLDHPLYAGEVGGSYERVHARIAAALAGCGVEAAPRGDRALASDVEDTGMCFHASHRLDLVWECDGGLRKGVGSAQRRSGGRVVHHGSIKLVADPLEPGVAHLDGAVEPRDLARRLRAELGVEQADLAPLDEREQARVEREFRPRFAGREWTERR